MNNFLKVGLVIWLLAHPAFAFDLKTIFYSRLKDSADAEELHHKKEVARLSKTLIKAIKKRDTLGVDSALRNGADPNTFNHVQTPALWLAAESGQILIVQRLLGQEGIVVDAVNEKESGSTALFAAALYGHTEVVEALIKAKAEVDMTCRENSTPLLAAAFHGRLASVQALVRAGGDYNHTRPDGVSALFVAAQNEHFEVVSFLLDLPGIKKDQIWQRFHQTPMLKAAVRRHWGIVKLLLDHGADPTIVQKEGEAAGLKVIDHVRQAIREKGLQRMSRSLGRQMDPDNLQELLERLEIYER